MRKFNSKEFLRVNKIVVTRNANKSVLDFQTNSFN